MEDKIIRESFFRVKEDILSLKSEINDLRYEFETLKNYIKELNTTLNSIRVNSFSEFNPSEINTTIRQITSTNPVTSTDTSTVPLEIGGLKGQNLDISTGNEGVSTDRQTIRQTDRQVNETLNLREAHVSSIDDDIKDVSVILDSLDTLRKDIRIKFKKVTDQEMAVFSTIYQIEEQNLRAVNYPEIAKRLNLTESSIRDYISRLINKGIPIIKEKVNNKKIVLKISPDLKKLATLSTIMQLREL